MYWNRWLLLAVWLTATLAFLHCWVKGIQEMTFFPFPSLSLQRSSPSVCAGQALWKQGAAVLGSSNQNVTDKLLCWGWVLVSLVILALQIWLQQVSVWDPPLHSLYCTLAVWGLTSMMSVLARLMCWNSGSLLSADQACSALLGTGLGTQTLWHDHHRVSPEPCWMLEHQALPCSEQGRSKLLSSTKLVFLLAAIVYSSTLTTQEFLILTTKLTCNSLTNPLAKCGTSRLHHFRY